MLPFSCYMLTYLKCTPFPRLLCHHFTTCFTLIPTLTLTRTLTPPQTGPSPPGYGTDDVSTSPLRLREEDGYEQARRVRNVIEHLRRGCAAHKPLVVVVANSGVPEEVSGGRGWKGRAERMYGATPGP